MSAKEFLIIDANGKVYDDSLGYLADSEWIGLNDLIKFIRESGFEIYFKKRNK